MKKIILIIVISFALIYKTAFAQSISLFYNEMSPQENYAAKELRQSLTELGFKFKNENSDYSIILKIDSKQLEKESYQINPENKKIIITGGDERGVIYGSFSLIEDLRDLKSIQKIKSKSETARLHFRAIKFDLPWDTYRHSYALTLHQETCKDLK